RTYRARKGGKDLGKVKDHMTKAYDFVDGNASLEELAEVLNKQNPAVLVKNRSNEVQIITIHDIIAAINPKS
ncbi:MAG: hypothetical protein QMC40_07680, partial [Vicingaceae bacterium]